MKNQALLASLAQAKHILSTLHLLKLNLAPSFNGSGSDYWKGLDSNSNTERQGMERNIHTAIVHRKNWLPFVLGPAFAMLRIPGPVCLTDQATHKSVNKIHQISTALVSSWQEVGIESNNNDLKWHVC